MTSALIVLAVLALVGYGLERRTSGRSGPRPRLAGSSDVLDRDLQRVAADLRVAPPAERAATARDRRVLVVRRAGLPV
ncbi:hypothetical protein [Umezawaea sp.]|uniref:hypothetical protein n=1 Tax=Umezawaea sp. TaxID=1955258 RepID=UPI002ED2103E